MTSPDPGEVHVWAISAADPPFAVAALRSLLNAEEQRRADRFRQPADRRRSVVGRGVLRLLLGERLGRRPEELEFDRTDQGKPILRGAGASQFNVSHSGDWVLIALSGAGHVGVDIEHIRPVRDLEAIAAHYFAPAEARAIQSLPLAERLRAFFACWTRKEAFVKALGTGLHMPLDRFVVSVTPGEAPALLSIDGSAEAAHAWLVADAAPDADYAAAVVGARGVRLVFRSWSGAAGMTTSEY